MTSNVKMISFIKFISIIAYIEKDNQDCERFKSTNFFMQLSKFYKDLGLSSNEYNFKWYEFKRYDASDFIDNEFLCENYLSFSALFEDTPAPTMIIDVYFANGVKNTIHIQRSDIFQNIDDLVDYLELKLIISSARYIN